MTKYELTEKLIDRLIDPWTDDPENYADAEPIDLAYATTLLADLRREDEDIDDDDCKVPEGTTPEILMETYNCLIKARLHELTERYISNMADFLTEEEMVCEYDQYRTERSDDLVRVLPTDFLIGDTDTRKFPFRMKDGNAPTIADLIEIGQNSSRSFRYDDTYCWYDSQNMKLHSTNTPYADGIIDAKSFAEWMFSPEGHGCLAYLVVCVMDESSIYDVFDMSEASVVERFHLSC